MTAAELGDNSLEVIAYARAKKKKYLYEWCLPVRANRAGSEVGCEVLTCWPDFVVVALGTVSLNIFERSLSGNGPLIS